MHSIRLLVAASLVASVACAKAPPAERFLARDTAMAVVIPSLRTFAAQSSEVLETAASFPGGQAVNDRRAVAESRLGFDPLDPASLEKAGFDPKRGIAVGFRMAEEGRPPEMIAALPVRNAKKLAATLDRLVKGQLELRARSVEKDGQEIVKWAQAEGGDTVLAYAIVEKTAVIGVGMGSVDLVKAALKLPKDGHLGTNPDYKAALDATGAAQAMVWYFSSQGPMFDQPQLAALKEYFKKGFAIGLSGAKDRLAFAVGMALDDASPLLKMARADARPLVARLDPNAGWVARSDTDIEATAQLQKVTLTNMLATMGTPGASAEALGAALDAVGGGGSAVAIGVVPVEAGAPAIREAPLAFFRAEALVSVKDAARMKQALEALGRESGTEGAPGVDLSGDGPWTFAVGGGEIGVALEEKLLLLTAGPKGSLAALAARSGSTFKPPTPAAQKAFDGSMGGMYIDVPKLAAGVKAIPAAAYGDDPGGTMLQANLQNIASALSRFTAVSVAADVKEKTLHGELVIEVAPPTAK
jgi:hypothetical protein